MFFREKSKNYIQPNAAEILKNERIGGKNSKRFVSALFSNIYHINSKNDARVGDLVFDLDIAIEQEKNLNQDFSKCAGRLTSNIGAILQSIKNNT